VYEINFICRGNVWRSRVAEAYAKYLLHDNSDIHISSSGIEASKDYVGPINIYTKLLLVRDGLWQYAHPDWVQTTQKIIDESDLTVFMNHDVYHDAVGLFKIPEKGLVIWAIPDRDEEYENIKSNVDKLVSKYLK